VAMYSALVGWRREETRLCLTPESRKCHQKGVTSHSIGRWFQIWEPAGVKRRGNNDTPSKQPGRNVPCLALEGDEAELSMTSRTAFRGRAIRNKNGANTESHGATQFLPMVGEYQKAQCPAPVSIKLTLLGTVATPRRPPAPCDALPGISLPASGMRRHRKGWATTHRTQPGGFKTYNNCRDYETGGEQRVWLSGSPVRVTQTQEKGEALRS